MIVELSNKGHLKIDQEALQRMLMFRQCEKSALEAGGVLLGRFISNSKDIIIDKVSIPMKGDKRERFRFFRSEGSHQRIIRETWGESAGKCNYLGEWHTHPEDYPTPSRIDKENWKALLSKGFFSSLYLYFVIVGREETRVWEGNKRTLKIKRLY